MATPTLKLALSQHIKRLEAVFSAAGYEAVEGFELTEPERSVFDIDLGRYPRMAATWDCYAALLGLFHRRRYAEDTLAAAREKHADIVALGKSQEGFRLFAHAVADMTDRECDAIMEQLRWRMVRAGNLGYADELGDDDED